MKKQALLNSDVDYLAALNVRVRNIEEFLGLGGQSKDTCKELHSRIFRGLEYGRRYSSVKVIDVFRLFKLFGDYFWTTVQIWEKFQFLTIPNKWYFSISCPTHTLNFSYIIIFEWMIFGAGEGDGNKPYKTSGFISEAARRPGGSPISQAFSSCTCALWVGCMTRAPSAI